jgi:hypothetical protein
MREESTESRPSVERRHPKGEEARVVGRASFVGVRITAPPAAAACPAQRRRLILMQPVGKQKVAGPL